MSGYHVTKLYLILLLIPLAIFTAVNISNLQQRQNMNIRTKAQTATVTITPGSDIAAIVDSNPAGTTYQIKAGTYTVSQSINPKSGDTFIGDDPATTIIDGNNTVVYAFKGLEVDPVTVKNLTFSHFNNYFTSAGDDLGVLQTDNDNHDWVIDNIIVTNNQGLGLSLGKNFHVTNSRILHNRTLGISGYICDGSVIENNEIAWNNEGNVAQDPALSFASGSKFVSTKNVIIRGNDVHDNNGNGVWFDTDNIGTVIENNRIYNNSDHGIILEVSYGAIVQNNTIWHNGFSDPTEILNGGVWISTSSNNQIINNNVYGNVAGASIWGEDRGAGSQGPYTSSNNIIQNNTFTNNKLYGMTGTVSQNTWSGNTYNIDCNAQIFHYLDSNNIFTSWQGLGFDTNSTTNCGASPAMDSLPVGAKIAGPQTNISPVSPTSLAPSQPIKDTTQNRL